MTGRSLKMILMFTPIFCLLAGGELRADLSFMAGDGNNVAYGRSLMRCNLPIDEKGTLGDVECLLVGTVQGLPVVAATHQTKATADQLFMVEIIDSGHARFSGSIANIISIKLHETTLAAVMTVEQWGYPYAQVLEIPHPDNPDRESILLLVNGTENVFMLDLRTTTEAATGLKILKAREYHRWLADVRIINLDRIDLNAYLKHPADKEPLPAALAVWYQRKGNFWNNRNFRTQANSLALAEVRTYGIELYQKLETVSPFDRMTVDGPDVWHMKEERSAQSYGVAGGAFINPDGNGAISYWFGEIELEYLYEVPYFTGRIHIKPRLTTHGTEIYYDPQAQRVMLKDPKRANRFGWDYWTKEWDRADTQINLYQRYGAWLKLRKDSDGALFIDGACSPRADKGPYWSEASTTIGKLEQHEGVNWSSVQQISEYDDKSESELTEMQRRERQLVNQGVRVSTVVYGWPYFGAKGTPGSSNTPSFARKESNQKISWKKESYGAGFNSEFGRQWGLPVKGKVVRKSSLSAVSGFSWSTGKQTTDIETTADKISVSYHDISFDNFSKEGIIVYNTVNPTLLEYGTFRPVNASSIHVDGLDETYELVFPVASVGVSQDTNLTYMRFDVTNPEKTLFDEASPLSTGLAPRPVTALRPGFEAVIEDVNRILDWQRANQVDEVVRLAVQKKAGLKVVKRFDYRPDIDKTMDYSKEHTSAQTTHWDWYAGIHWKTTPDVTGFLADVTVKHNGSIDTSDSTSSGKAYTPEQRGIPDPGYARVLFATYFIEVDISKLKNWIVKKKDDPVNPFKGRPAVVPQWNWKYDQDFTLVITRYEGLHLEDTAAISRLFRVKTPESKQAQKALVSLIAGYNAEGRPLTLELAQQAAPAQKPANLYLPLGMAALQTKRGYVGIGAEFTLYVGGEVPVNGLWVKRGPDEWVDIATSVVWEGDRTRVTFVAEDGQGNDEDGAVNSRITLHAAPGWLMSHSAAP